jgi:hypothetical protein
MLVPETRQCTHMCLPQLPRIQCGTLHDLINLPKTLPPARGLMGPGFTHALMYQHGNAANTALCVAKHDSVLRLCAHTPALTAG